MFTMVCVVLTIVELPLYVGFQLASTGTMKYVDTIVDSIFWSDGVGSGGCGRVCDRWCGVGWQD